MSYSLKKIEQTKIMKKQPIKLKNKSETIIFICFLTIFMLFFLIINNFTLFLKGKVLADENYYYTTEVEHLFTHCLIAYPEIAFDKNNPMNKYYDIDCITSKEFINILDSLYKNNYALVSLNKCFGVDDDGNAFKKKIKIPKCKKALVLSFDDVNYDHKKMGYGMVDKIIVDKNGNLASSTKFGKFEDIRYDVEFIPILENFVKKHPDFSVDGAKGVINLTGYDGILGYRTSHTNLKDRQSEIDKAQKVADVLKNNGWEFASHSYGHYHMNKIDLSKWQNELKLWHEEVEPIVGATKIYVYPYGEWQVFENGEICKKHRLLNEYGFALFCGVGMKTFFSYLPNKNHKVLFMDRKCVDGSTLKAFRKELLPFFNPKLVLDSARNSISPVAE